MPLAARPTDPTGHGSPLAPGPGSPDVEIGLLPAWRALPATVGAAVDAISNTMSSFLTTPTMNPGSAASDLVKISQNLGQGGAKAAAAGAPAAASTASTQVGTLTTANTALTATWTAASVVPGGQPAADLAYTQGIKAAAAAAAAATLSAMASLADMHMCPLPTPIPHGPGFVTKGSKSVVVNDLPACRQNDQIMEACGGSDPIAMGCPTVEIGDDGGPPVPGDPAAEIAKALEQAERLSQARSSAAALVAAAAAGRALLRTDLPCWKFGGAARVAFRVVDEETGHPQAGVELSIRLPNGTEELHTTDADGMIAFDPLDQPGACTVRCKSKGARNEDTFAFVRLESRPR